jgi:hypothetical protein
MDNCEWAGRFGGFKRWSIMPSQGAHKARTRQEEPAHYRYPGKETGLSHHPITDKSLKNNPQQYSCIPETDT